MFSRKRRSISNPPPNYTPSAASAAAQAFIKKQADDGVLSSSAAAAALRSHQSTPTPVADIQTKRMVRRGSASSHGSPAGSYRQPFTSGLQRQNSGGSMSQRTLRSPSPSRRVAPSPSNDVPPVPTPPTIPPKSIKRSASLDPPPNRVTSPFQNIANMSKSANTSGQTANQPRKRAMAPGNLEKVPEKGVAPAASPSSPRQQINFSRPMSPEMRALSPQSNASASPTVPRGALRPRPASSLGFSHEDDTSLPVQTRINIARAKQNANPALSAAASAARPASIVGSQGPLRKPSSKNKTPRPASMVVTGEITEEPDKKPDSGVDMATRRVVRQLVPPKLTPEQRASAALAVPSPTEDQIKKFQTRAASLLAHSNDAEPPQPISQPSKDASQLRSADTSSLTAPNLTPKISMPQRSATTGFNRLSVSPARSAHFSDSPVLEAVKHAPPPRSISPFKSAMKSSSPGPSPDISRVRDTSVNSEARSQLSDDSNAAGSKRKKNVRVSFDEKAILVGEAAPSIISPTETVLSPQYRPDDEDTGMGVRPALPSFGSVRARNAGLAEPSSPTQVVNSAKDFSGFAPQGSDADLETPSINVQPATPRAVDDDNEMQLDSPKDRIPVADNLEESLSAADAPDVLHSRPKPTEVPSVPSAPVSDKQDNEVRERDSDEDASEVFSDAAEEQDGLEASGGYASLNAIVESPPAKIVQKNPLDEVQMPSAASKPTQIESLSAPPPADGENWDEVKTYWNSLSEDRKLELEAAAQNQQEQQTEKEVENAAPKTSTKPVSNGQETLPPWPDKQYRASVKPQKSALKKTTPAEQPAQVSESLPMRKSMRNSKVMPSSMRGTYDELAARGQGGSRQQKQQKASANPNTRPVPGASSAAIALAQGVAAAQSQSKSSASDKNKKKPPLGRSLSNDSSASDSSFQRSRRRKPQSNGGRYSMARSMRGDTNAVEPEPNVVASQQTNSKKTARLSMRSPEPSKSNKSSGLLGFGKSKQKSSKKGTTKSPPKVGSRFSDSSDDEDYGRPKFQSRFDDSDDSNEDTAAPTKLTPVRGIPRKPGQQSGESTDLSDEEDEPARKQRPVTPPAQKAPEQQLESTPTANGIAQGTALSAGTLRQDAENEAPEKGSRLSMFGLGRRRAGSDAPGNSPAPEKVSVSTPPDSPILAKTVRPSRKSAQSPSRATRMFRRLSNSRNNSPHRGMSKEDFPFPPPPIPDEYKNTSPQNTADRPNTSDGVGQSNMIASRPELGPKRDSVMTAPESTTSANKPKREPVFSERTGKKKKFQGLRRAFGLND